MAVHIESEEENDASNGAQEESDSLPPPALALLNGVSGGQKVLVECGQAKK